MRCRSAPRAAAHSSRSQEFAWERMFCGSFSIIRAWLFALCHVIRHPIGQAVIYRARN